MRVQRRAHVAASLNTDNNEETLAGWKYLYALNKQEKNELALLPLLLVELMNENSRHDYLMCYI